MNPTASVLKKMKEDEFRFLVDHKSLMVVRRTTETRSVREHVNVEGPSLCVFKNFLKSFFNFSITVDICYYISFRYSLSLLWSRKLRDDAVLF